MPPSIADNRQSAQHALTHDDGSQHHQSQAVRDFQTRKKLLAGSAGISETNSNKNNISMKRSNKKRATNKEKKTCSTLGTPVKITPALESSSTAVAALNTGTGTGTGYGGGMLNNSLGGLGGLGSYGMAGMGYGMYGGMGMMGSPYMMGGPLNGLNQFLFGIQTAIYSLTSAVQVIGMNTHALHQLLDAASSMVDHAQTTFHEMRALESTERENETDEQKMRRRRLKALRWGLCLAASYAAFRLIRNIVFARKRGRQRRIAGGGEPYGYSSSSMLSSPASYGGYSPYAQQSSYMSPYGSGGGIQSSYMSPYGSGGGMGMIGSSLGYGGGGYY